MNAAVVYAFDAPPRYTSFAQPVAADGEVVIGVIATSLHPIMKALASGSHYASTGTLPFIAGVDGVGRQQESWLPVRKHRSNPYLAVTEHIRLFC
jgi:NADPH2:quinone reductase